MEFKINKNELKKAIMLSRRALSKAVIQEERGHLLFIVKDSIISIQGTNNDLKSCCSIEIENIEGKSFSFTADPKMLEKLVSKCDTKDIRIIFNQNEYTTQIFTTDTGKSFSTLQSFPPDKMLTIGDIKGGDRNIYTVNKEVLLFTLKYALNFMTSDKEDGKQFDLLSIKKGICSASNGSSKIGFIVFKTFEKIPSINIRKNVIPILISFIEKVEGQEINIIDTDNNIGIESIDDSKHFSFLKSRMSPPELSRDHIKSSEPYVLINKNDLLKVIERVIISSTSTLGIGLKFILSGNNENASLEIELVSKKNKSVEVLPCIRKDESNETLEHVVDYKLLKSVIGSFTTKENIRFHICDNTKFFKIYNKGEIDGQKYILAGVGTFAKIVRQ